MGRKILVWLSIYTLLIAYPTLRNVTQRRNYTPTQQTNYTLFSQVPPIPTQEVEAIITEMKYVTPVFSEYVLSVTGEMTLAKINKIYALPKDFIPSNLINLSSLVKTIGPEQLRGDAANGLKLMFEEALSLGYELAVLSGYRSYEVQQSTFNRWVKIVGYENASLVSARPGHSEHQLGTTVDLTSKDVGFKLTRTFGDSPSGKWVAQNAHAFGFVMSYPKGKTQITGYAYEPWHFRYVGVKVATEIYERAVTFEEYLSGE